MRERGVSILEVVIALAILVVAATGLFATLSAATAASQESARQAQARAEAMAVLESILQAPRRALDCLTGAPVEAWSRCSDGKARFATSPSSGLELVHDAGRDSFVRKRAARFYDVQITVAGSGVRGVTVASGVFR